MEGIIFDIKRFAIHDGPGIRTSVFFKGCPLNCSWCHNPESRKFGIEMIRSGDPCDVLQLGYTIDENVLMNIILKDKVYYSHSGGGVTFTGGEPTAQIDFLASMLKQCKYLEIHTAVDTSGFVKKEALEKIIENTDLFLFDIKHMDDTIHRKVTGISNRQILDNLQYIDDNNKEIFLRIPLIPGVNDSEAHISSICEYAVKLKNVSRVHLLPYHRTGKHKYQKFNIREEIPAFEEPGKDVIKSMTSLISSYNFEVITGG